ncbi:alpha/beta fold hydrolase [Pseudomonas lini]|uniref:alpha/beta fold hydrolase n=1 Tax=Pseudomonas lini TaxID=163011 RepID=UPI00345E4694
MTGANGYLATDDGHQLYWERHGTLGGEPVFFLHGGPGGRCSRHHLEFFDLRCFDVILLDQRGCGRSRPYGQTRRNSTGLNVEDIDALRLHLGLERISLLGVSWGSWLAIQYQQRYPAALLKTTLVSIFVPFEANRSAYEEAIDAALSEVGGGTTRDIHQTLNNGGCEQQRQAAIHWLQATLRLNGQSMPLGALKVFVDEEAVHAIRLELHYHVNRYFFSVDDENLSLNTDTLVIQGIKDTFGMASLRWLRERQPIHCRLLRAGHNAFELPVLKAVRQSLKRAYTL